MVIGVVVFEKIFQQGRDVSTERVVGAIVARCRQWRNSRPHIPVVLIVPDPARAYHQGLLAIQKLHIEKGGKRRWGGRFVWWGEEATSQLKFSYARTWSSRPHWSDVPSMLSTSPALEILLSHLWSTRHSIEKRQDVTQRATKVHLVILVVQKKFIKSLGAAADKRENASNGTIFCWE